MNAPLFAELRRWLRQSGVRGARRRIEPEVAAVLRHWRAVNDMPGGMPFYPCLTFPVRGHPLRVDVETDAAGTVGYGAIMFPPGDDKSLSPVYFVGKWLPWEAEELDINVKELLVTVWVLTIIAELWPSHCAQLYLTEHIDNQVAQAVARRGSSKRSAWPQPAWSSRRGRRRPRRSVPVRRRAPARGSYATCPKAGWAP